MSGQSPTWNQAFLFYLEHGDPKEYWLRFTLMRDKIVSSDGGGIGQVVIGSYTTGQGKAHWEEVMQPFKFPEVSKWHEITNLNSQCL